MLNLEASRREAFENGLQNTEALEEAIKLIENSTLAGPGLKLNAKLQRLTLDGNELAKSVLNRIVQVRLQSALDVAIEVQSVVNEINSEVGDWESSLNEHLEKLGKGRQTLDRANAITVGLQIRFLILFSFSLFSSEPDPKLLPVVMDDLKDAEEIFSSLGVVDGLLRTRALHANFLELIGENEAAKRLAESVLATAKIYGYGAMEDACKEILEGQSMVSKLRHAQMRQANVDEDLRISESTEEAFVEGMSRECLRALDLPETFLPNLQSDARRTYHEAKLRVEWCKHFHICHIVDPKVTEIREQFRQPFQYFCYCSEKKIQGTMNSLDSVEVADDFQKLHCRECQLRSPKNLSAAEPSGN